MAARKAAQGGDRGRAFRGLRGLRRCVRVTQQVQRRAGRRRLAAPRAATALRAARLDARPCTERAISSSNSFPKLCKSLAAWSIRGPIGHDSESSVCIWPAVWPGAALDKAQPWAQPGLGPRQGPGRAASARPGSPSFVLRLYRPARPAARTAQWIPSAAASPGVASHDGVATPSPWQRLADDATPPCSLLATRRGSRPTAAL